MVSAADHLREKTDGALRNDVVCAFDWNISVGFSETLREGHQSMRFLDHHLQIVVVFELKYTIDFGKLVSKFVHNVGVLSQVN